MPPRFGRNYSAVSEELFAAISAYIDEVYAGAPADALHDPNRARFSRPSTPFDAPAQIGPLPEDAGFTPESAAFGDDDLGPELSPGSMADGFGQASPPPAAPVPESEPAAQPKAAREAEPGALRRERLHRAKGPRSRQPREDEILPRSRQARESEILPRSRQAREDEILPRSAKSSRGLGGLFRRSGTPAPSASLEDMLSQIDESFGQTLLRRIDERRLTDAQCYKRANVDRRLFNKIKNNPDYRPGKQTVLAFAIALRLSLEETRDLLMKAGYALSHSSKSDIVVEYCILNGIYDIIEINQVLFRLDLQPLGY